MNQYEICGRQLKNAPVDAPVFKMTIFATNDIIAESRFWYFLNSLQRIKKSNGQLVSIKKVTEDDSTVRTYGITIRYRTQVGHQNQYREIRETTAARAMEKLFSVMAGQYHIRYQDVQIIKFDIVKNEDVRRPIVMDVIPGDHNGNKVEFPHYFPVSTCVRASRKTIFVIKQ
ncbi:60S ribosomal protein L18a [Spironucleus salmonicida]|uniref:60S ribosomal protein L18a n=1 Tax=Spironucleus salmonicida TaxID=348837 RepID=V6LVQ9_9EUKA|nr:60S ribosomal protein L18a [Spironucleus salmonicida]|eukprot:EST48333.1 Ribosomal protein L18a [Spironucleus salmonicida]